LPQNCRIFRKIAAKYCKFKGKNIMKATGAKMDKKDKENDKKEGED
jgi:hypothetical protein